MPALFLMLAMLAQSEDIFVRLRQAMPDKGAGEQALSALSAKNFARVEELLAEVQAPDRPGRAELLSLQGAVAFLAGNMSAAVKAFDQASQFAPLKDADSFTLAMALVQLRDEPRARSVIASLSKKHPDRALYLYWLGKIDYNDRRYDEAVQKLKKASDLDPGSARVWDSLGLAFDMQGQMEQALEAFEKAATLNRSQSHPSPWPPHDLGYLLLRMDKPNEAVAALRESVGYDGNLAQSHYHLGRALEKEGRETDAVNEYVSAVADDRQAPDACYSLGMLYRKLHRNKEAGAMFAEFKKRKEAQTVPDLTRQRDAK